MFVKVVFWILHAYSRDDTVSVERDAVAFFYCAIYRVWLRSVPGKDYLLGAGGGDW